MVNVKRRRRATKPSKAGADILERLKPGEARTVLHRLLEAHPELAAEAKHMARSILGGVSFQAIADKVERAVRGVDLDDLGSRSGRTAYGYVEPTEAAWELLEEAVTPFVDDIRRQVELGLEAEALEICKGVVLGVYRLRDERSGEILGWAPDFPEEAAGRAIDAWRTSSRRARRAGRRRPEFPRDFIDRDIPDWTKFIARLLPRRPA